MRHLFVFVLATLAFQASAQHQVKIDPANLGDDYVIEDVVRVGSDYVHAGQKSSQAVVTCHTPLGTLLWSKICGSISVGRSVACASGGKIVVAGERINDAFAAAFNSDGTVAWSKSFETDSTERWNCVATDASGNAYLVGHKRTNSANSREIWMKLDLTGDTVWTKQALRPSDAYSSFGYCFVKGDSLIAIGVTRNNGVASFGNKDISLTIISTATGNVLSHHYFGTVGFESFIDAEANQQGFAVLFGIGNSLNGFGPSRAVLKVSWSALGSPATAMILEPSFGQSYTLDMGGELTLDGSDVYVSGGLTGVGTQGSYVLKLGSALNINWAKRVTTGSSLHPAFGNASVGFGGGVTLVDIKNGATPVTGSIMTTLSSTGIANGIACELPTGFSVEALPYWMGAGTQTLPFGDLIFDIAPVTFVDYSPSVTSCGGLLPVEMLSFTGEQIDQTVELRFTTASEHNNSHFDVMRSRDGVDWEKIDEVPGAGNSLVSISYDLVDESPFDGTNYYMLRQVDLDGTEHNSEVIAVDFLRSVHPMLALWPNPLTRGMSLQGLDGKAFEVLDILGRVVQGSGFDTNLDHLPPATYVIRITATPQVTARVILND